MGRTLVYPKRPNNTVNRSDTRGKCSASRGKRNPSEEGYLIESIQLTFLSHLSATYDLHDIHSIINSTPVLHVSFNSSDPAQGPFPAILPMIGVMGSFKYPSADLTDPLDCYLHGYVSARMMNLARAQDAEGLPVSIAATKVDGVVLSLTPNSHSYDYRSAVLFGHASLVTEDDEKLWAMQLITNAVVPGRWENSRVPPDRAEMVSTSILRVSIVSGSGKIRDGGPHDEKKDLEREDIVNSTWTGVVPMWETVGEPVAGSTNAVEDVPEHVRAFQRETCSSNEAYAKKATT